MKTRIEVIADQNELVNLMKNNSIYNYFCEAKAFADEVSTIYPCEVIAVFNTYNTSNGSEEYYNLTARLKGTNLEIRKIEGWGSKKSYYLISPVISLQTLPCLNYQSYSYVINKSNLVEPNKIGILSKSKIDAWVNYWNEAEKLCRAYSEETTNKVNNFIKEVKEQNKPGIKFVIDKEERSGYFSRNGIRFSWSIDANGYITKKLEFDFFIDNTIENFALLADNKYFAPVKK